MLEEFNTCWCNREHVASYTLKGLNQTIFFVKIVDKRIVFEKYKHFCHLRASIQDIQAVAQADNATDNVVLVWWPKIPNEEEKRNKQWQNACIKTLLHEQRNSLEWSVYAYR